MPTNLPSSSHAEMANMRLGHQIVGIQQCLILLDRQDRSRHDLLDRRLMGVGSSRDHPPNHIGIRQDADDLLPVRHEQAADATIPHDTCRRLRIRIPLNRNKLLSRNHERLDCNHANSSFTNSIRHPTASCCLPASRNGDSHPFAEMPHNGICQCRHGILSRHDRNRQPIFLCRACRNGSDTGNRHLSHESSRLPPALQRAPQNYGRWRNS